MNDSAEAEARRALIRLRRSMEKAERDLEALTGALRHAEGSDFPVDAFNEATNAMQLINRFVDEQEQRLADKILHAGGLEPGRIRRGD